MSELEILEFVFYFTAFGLIVGITWSLLFLGVRIK
jgi:hypothetical protein